MLRSLTNLFSYNLEAKDGVLGIVNDFLFDDESWSVRYVVADTGNWLPDRKVVLSPSAVRKADWLGNRVYLNLTKDEVERSPALREHEPISRRLERELAIHYEWPLYWAADMPALAGVGAIPPQTEKSPRDVEEEESKKQEGNFHLRSVREVTGYRIEAEDGSIGHIEDFIANDKDWITRYLVVDTRNWLPGKKVLIVPSWVRSVSWSDSIVHVDYTKAQIKGSPEFDSSAPINREYEARYYDYYGRPKYWEEVLP